MIAPAGQRLQAIVARADVALRRIDAAAAARSPRPGAWSKQEILGHLLDSAVNNHLRCVRAALEPQLRMPGYEQAGWVRVQDYATADWPALVTLWGHYNLHLARVLERLPAAALAVPCHIGNDAPVPLSRVVEGYLEHALHHLGQIASELGGWRPGDRHPEGEGGGA